MKKKILFLLFMGCSLLLATTANAEETARTLSSTEIKSLLNNATALYDDGARQFFAANGHTDYRTANGANSVGSWRVSDDKYCSIWSPGGSSCYTVTRHDNNTDTPIIRWNNQYQAKIYPGNLMDKN
ncbi:MAG: DUF995 domain-containing protein [Gammaproteobacteria bacterium WSBS_2016_MAG_OTU1]